jgi:hypothetical protein
MHNLETLARDIIRDGESFDDVISLCDYVSQYRGIDLTLRQREALWLILHGM